MTGFNSKSEMAADKQSVACKHTRIVTFFDEETNEPTSLWGCSECGCRFEPLTQRQPLTDEQVKAVIRAGEYDSMEDFARAIEAAHGIKGEAIAVERANAIAQIIALLESQHEFAKHTHNYWLVAANLIRAEFCDGKKAAHGIKGES